MYLTDKLGRLHHTSWGAHGPSKIFGRGRISADLDEKIDLKQICFITFIYYTTMVIEVKKMPVFANFMGTVA